MLLEFKIRYNELKIKTLVNRNDCLILFKNTLLMDSTIPGSIFYIYTFRSIVSGSKIKA